MKPAPVKSDSNDFWEMLRYCLISVPSYKAYCFLTDRYMLAFFHTAILTVLVTLLGLIGFMLVIWQKTSVRLRSMTLSDCGHTPMIRLK